MQFVTPNGICRGDLIKEAASGFTGVCNGISISNEGSITVGIQPPANGGGKLPDTVWFDAKSCDTINMDLRARFTYQDVYLGFAFGAKVQDIYTKQTGRITEVVLHQNGCIRCLVIVEGDGSDGAPKNFWASQHCLEILDAESHPLKTQNPEGGAPTKDKPLPR